MITPEQKDIGRIVICSEDEDGPSRAGILVGFVGQTCRVEFFLTNRIEVVSVVSLDWDRCSERQPTPTALARIWRWTARQFTGWSEID